MNPGSKPRYSVVVPIFNERECVMPLYQELKEMMDAAEGGYECIFVDDGSTDGTSSLLRDIASVDSRIVNVRMRHNSGKSAALCAGFRVAQGEFVVTLDGDLQHNPADIPLFVEQLEAGCDIVSGRRTNRAESWLQRVSTYVANRVIARLTGVPIHDFGGGFKGYRRDLVSDLPIYGELQRLIPALAMRKSVAVCELPIEIRDRTHGTSKYGISTKLPVIFDLITVRFLLRYLSRPLHFFGSAGLLSLLIGSGIGVLLLLERFIYGVQVMTQHGPLLIFAAVLIMAGVQLIALGLLAEMQVRHYHENNTQQENYVITSSIGANSQSQ